jgi:hypothetical protein
MPEHLDSDLVAAYAEQRLDQSERGRVEAHVADCADCRRELTEVSIALAAGRRRRGIIRAVPVAAAAVLALLVIGITSNDAGDQTQDQLRPGSDLSDGVSTLAVHAPISTGSLSRAGLRFIWSGSGADALYDFTITDSSGTVVLRARTSDTLLILPDTLRLVPGSRYHWWVDVLQSDGRVASSGIRELVVRP